MVFTQPMETGGMDPNLSAYVYTSFVANTAHIASMV